MDVSVEVYEELIRKAARLLKGHTRRLFQAQVANALCHGSPRAAERRFGFDRQAVATGQHEAETGIRCLEDFAARARPRSEVKDPQLAQDIRAIVEPHTSTDPGLKSPRRYTNLSAAEVCDALIATGYAKEELPRERTMRDILNRMNYRLKRLQKGKPLKKVPETDAIFANVQQVREQARTEPETLEISMDAKAKLSLGESVRGGKNPDRQPRCGAQRLGSRPAGEGEAGPVRHPDDGDRGVAADLRRAGYERRLGRCPEALVAPGPGRPRAHQTAGDLLG